MAKDTPEDKPKRQRVQLDLTQEQYDALTRLAELSGHRTRAQSARDGIGLLVTYTERTRAGGKFYFESPDGTKTEILLPSYLCTPRDPPAEQQT